MTVDETRLRQLVQVFLAENQKLNLSAFRSEEHCWTGNVLDSLALLQAVEAYPQLKTIGSLCDIGTGGGFPLLPLALCLPGTRCLGMDSIAKKVDAVRRIAETMEMKNAELICGRLEELGHDEKYREKFDIVTARAVAPISVIMEYAVPLLKVGGLCVFWKSTKLADELKSSAVAQKSLKCPFAGTFEYDLPAEWGKRTLVFFKKAGPTPSDYPRKVGLPKQKPL